MLEEKIKASRVNDDGIKADSVIDKVYVWPARGLSNIYASSSKSINIRKQTLAYRGVNLSGDGWLGKDSYAKGSFAHWSGHAVGLEGNQNSGSEKISITLLSSHSVFLVMYSAF